MLELWTVQIFADVIGIDYMTLSDCVFVGKYEDCEKYVKDNNLFGAGAYVKVLAEDEKIIDESEVYDF